VIYHKLYQHGVINQNEVPGMSPAQGVQLLPSISNDGREKAERLGGAFRRGK
jgi:hypothetical protein